MVRSSVARRDFTLWTKGFSRVAGCESQELGLNPDPISMFEPRKKSRLARGGLVVWGELGVYRRRSGARRGRSRRWRDS